MKRFKIKFPLNGEESELYVEVMDSKDTRFSVSRELNDPQPLIIEMQPEGICEVRSENSWPLSTEELKRLGEALKTGDHESFDTGVHAK